MSVLEKTNNVRGAGCSAASFYDSLSESSRRAQNKRPALHS